jgi:hypothetical protein
MDRTLEGAVVGLNYGRMVRTSQAWDFVWGPKNYMMR